MNLRLKLAKWFVWQTELCIRLSNQYQYQKSISVMATKLHIMKHTALQTEPHRVEQGQAWDKVSSGSGDDRGIAIFSLFPSSMSGISWLVPLAALGEKPKPARAFILMPGDPPSIQRVKSRPRKVRTEEEKTMTINEEESNENTSSIFYFSMVKSC